MDFSDWHSYGILFFPAMIAAYALRNHAHPVAVALRGICTAAVLVIALVAWMTSQSS